jgi:hypothetical protein
LEVHLEHRLLQRAGHPPVALEDLREGRHLPRPRHADLLDVPGGSEGTPVAAVALAASSLGALASPPAGGEVLGLELSRHLLLHDPLKYAFDGVADAVFHPTAVGWREAVTAFVTSSWVMWDLVGLTHKKQYTTQRWIG